MYNGKKVIALIQARCTSTRLQKKHFRYIGSKRLIDWVTLRLKEVNYIDKIVISTSGYDEDIAFKEYAKNNDIDYYGYTGDVNDVVGRHYNAALKYNADYIIIISGDCPCISTWMIDEFMKYITKGYDNVIVKKRYIHEGVMVLPMKMVKYINEYSLTPYERENYAFIMKRDNEKFNVLYIDIPEIYSKNIFRVSVDNMADLKFMNEAHNRLEAEGIEYNIDNLLAIVEKNPDILKINAHVSQKKEEDMTFKVAFYVDKDMEKEEFENILGTAVYMNEAKHNGIIFLIENKEYAHYLRINGYIEEIKLVTGIDDIKSEIGIYNPDIIIMNIRNKRQSCGLDNKKRIVYIGKIDEGSCISLDETVEFKHILKENLNRLENIYYKITGEKDIK